jgi:hypothetical protein
MARASKSDRILAVMLRNFSQQKAFKTLHPSFQPHFLAETA